MLRLTIILTNNGNYVFQFCLSELLYCFMRCSSFKFYVGSKTVLHFCII